MHGASTVPPASPGVARNAANKDVPTGFSEAEDAARARCYALLGRLLGAPPPAELLDALAGMNSAGSDDSPLSRTLAALVAGAAAITPEAVAEEFHTLFIGLTEGEVVPYGSWYQTGFLHDRPLAELRGDLARLKVARVAGVSEPEDHVAFLCETMAGLIGGAYGDPLALDGQREFFERHLAPWAGRFFADLEAAPSAAFYRPVAALGRLFIDIETKAFSMAA